MYSKTFEQVREEMFQRDPELRKRYDALGPRYELIARIMELRIKYDLTQAQLAKMIGTKQSAISRLESGDYNPSVQLLEKIAKALNKKLTVTFS